MTDRVSNEGLREAFLRTTNSGVSQASIARHCGWMRTRARAPMGDVTHLKRLLGVTPFHSYHAGKRYTYYRKTVSYDDAVKIALAIGADPFEVGI